VVWQDTTAPVFRSLRRFKPLNPDDGLDKEVYPWLVGRSVLFVGVPSTIIGTTPIEISHGSSYSIQADVLFAESIDSFSLNPLAKSVYVPMQPGDAQSQFPGWHCTGRSVKNFFEYCRNQVHSQTPTVLDVGQTVEGVRYAAVELFPSLDATEVGHALCVRREKPSGSPRFFSVKVNRDGNAQVLPFTPSLWRSSIWEFMGDWGLLIQTQFLSTLMKKYCFDGVVGVPWDANKVELSYFERGSIQPFLRECWVLQRVFSKEMVEEKRDGKTLRMWINTQKEFVIVRTHMGFQLRTTARSHPSGALFDKFERILEDARNLPYESGYHDVALRLVNDHENYQLPGMREEEQTPMEKREQDRFRLMDQGIASFWNIHKTFYKDGEERVDWDRVDFLSNRHSIVLLSFLKSNPGATTREVQDCTTGILRREVPDVLRKMLTRKKVIEKVYQKVSYWWKEE